MPRTSPAALLVALAFAATHARAAPPVLQSLLDEGWTVLSETVGSRAYYRVEAQRTREGYRRAWMVVDMDATSIRVQREFDCRHARMRNRGATFFAAPGLQGEGREMRGWDAWMGYLSYDSARDPSDVNGILSDRVCAAPVAHP